MAGPGGSAKTIPANEGMNRFAWDLRYDEPIQIPGAFYLE